MEAQSIQLDQIVDAVFFFKWFGVAGFLVGAVAAVLGIAAFFRRNPSLESELAKFGLIEAELNTIRERLDGFQRNRVTADRASAIERSIDKLERTVAKRSKETERVFRDILRALGRSEGQPSD